jgi:hypothetical protein
MSNLIPFSSGNRFIRGTFAKWDETKGWRDKDGVPLPDTVFILGYTTVLQKWKDGKAEVKSEHPLPDPELLNSQIPVEEWEADFSGKPTKPWKLTFVVWFVNLHNGALFTYANNTYGAMLAYNALEEQIAVIRLLRGEQVLPVVRLDRRPMDTNFGMKSRPHFDIIDWRVPGSGGGGPTLPPQPPTPQISGPTTPSTPAPPSPVTPSTPTTPPPAPATAGRASAGRNGSARKDAIRPHTTHEAGHGRRTHRR